MPHRLKHVFATMLLALTALFGSAAPSAAQDPPAPPVAAPADDLAAIDHVLALLTDSESRAALVRSLEDLRTALAAGMPPPVSTASAAEATEPDAAEPAMEPPGDLISTVVEEIARLGETIPEEALHAPLASKIDGTAEDVAGWWRHGVLDHGIERFILWAAPGWIAAAAVAALGHVALHVVRGRRRDFERWCREGTRPALAWRVLAALEWALVPILLAVLALLAWSATAEDEPGRSHLFLAIALPVIGGWTAGELASHALMLLGPTRGWRKVGYARLRIAPWIGRFTAATLASAALRNPDVAAVLGQDFADVAALLLDIAIGGFAVAVMLRYRLPVRSLILRSHRAASDIPDLPAPIRGAVYLLARNWHILGTLFMLASLMGRLLNLRGGDFIVTAVLTVLVLIVGLSASALVDGVLARSAARSIRRRGRYGAPILARFIAAWRIAIQVLLFALLCILCLDIWGFEAGRWLQTEAGRAVSGRAMTILLAFLVGWMIWVLADAGIEMALSPVDQRGRVRPQNPRVRTLLPLLRNIVFVALSVITVIAVLANLGVDVTPLLAGAGVVGLAIGFGSQQLVQDVITGMFILFEDTIAIGDVIDTGDRAGVVEALTIRTVRIRDADGALHSIPFSQIKALKNRSRDYGVYTVKLSLDYATDIDAAMALMRKVGAEMQSDPRYGCDMLAGLDIWGVDQFASDGVVVIAALKTKPLRQWSVGREFNRRLKGRFDAAGIRVALPRISVLGPGGETPPAGEAPEPAPQGRHA